MTDLIVDRLHVRAAVNGPDDEARVRALLADLTGRRLEEELASSALPPGEWAVRRLDTSLTLDHVAGDAALGRRWAREVTLALTTALAAGRPEVVHYARPTDAVADVIAGLAVGDHRREWAWRAVGALTTADPDPAVDPAGAALAALERDHGSVVHVLSAAVRVAGLPAVHRLLTAPGWQRAAAAALAASGQSARRWLQGEPPAGDSGGTADGDAGGDPAPIVAGIVARSVFAEAWRRSRLRPSPATARAWALLAAVEVEPVLLRRPIAEQVLAALPGAVDRTAVTAAVTAAVDPRPIDAPVVDVIERSAVDLGGVERATPSAVPPAIALESAPETGTSTGGSSDVSGPSDAPVEEPRPADLAHLPPGPRRSEHDQPPAVPFPESDPVGEGGGQGLATVWGGLVHLFATAAAAGLPDEAFADEELAGRPASWILFHLVHAMTGNAPDALADPATRAVAGLPPQAPAPAPEPNAGQRVQIARLADRWARVTAERLGPVGQADSPRAVVTRLARRSGTVHHSPGWIEFELRMSDVELDVRRAGLDLDPGYVAWLGAVVVIRYA
ncbi:MAG TPA: hypothetical protein VES03_04500 [Motilibacterales bacterium]|nr:hypothetical protein [Motilibacterales bacterium]